MLRRAGHSCTRNEFSRISVTRFFLSRRSVTRSPKTASRDYRNVAATRSDKLRAANTQRTLYKSPERGTTSNKAFFVRDCR